MFIPRTPAKSNVITLLLADFRRFNTETEDIREMLEKNSLCPYVYDRLTYTSIPFKKVVPNTIWRDTYEQVNAEIDPEMIFYYFAKRDNGPILVVCSPVENINSKYDRALGRSVEERKDMWKYSTYVRGCSTHGYEESLENVIAKCHAR